MDPVKVVCPKCGSRFAPECRGYDPSSTACNSDEEARAYPCGFYWDEERRRKSRSG